MLSSQTDKSSQVKKSGWWSSYVFRLLAGLVLAFLLSLLIVRGDEILRLVREYANQKTMILEEACAYDTRLKEKLRDAAEKEQRIVLYNKGDAMLTNQDFSRSGKFQTIGVAGDLSLLLPEENRFSFLEKGYCILGEDVAVALFGTTKVSGRKVLIGEEEYIVSGVAYRRKDICFYELEESKAESFQYVTYGFESQAECITLQKLLENNFGLTENTLVIGNL